MCSCLDVYAALRFALDGVQRDPLISGASIHISVIFVFA